MGGPAGNSETESSKKAEQAAVPWAYWGCFAAILAVAAFVRCYWIDLRPLHNDEGVNAYFLDQMENLGYYPYSHENYHGPSYFYLTALCRLLFGTSEFALRSSAIFMGVLVVAAVAMLRRYEGLLFTVIAAALIALSSSNVFYARYAIHETLFLFSTMMLGLGAYCWMRSKRPAYLYVCGAALGVLISTKETFIISLFCLFFAFVCAGNPLAEFRALWQARRHIYMALTVAGVIIIALFTGGFQWAGGLREMVLAVPQWIGRNESDTGHFKVAPYYLEMALGPDPVWRILKAADQFLQHLYLGKISGALVWVWDGLSGWLLDSLSRGDRREFEHWLQRKFTNNTGILAAVEPLHALTIGLPLLYFACFPRTSLRALRSPEASFGRFSAVWAALAFFVYSFVDYKTPWLVINITLPSLLFLAWCLRRVFDYPWYGTFSGSIALAFAVMVSAFYTWRFNFEIAEGKGDPYYYAYGRGNVYAYVHTRPGMLELVADIRRYAETHKEAAVLVGVAQYWPLPYYLDGHKSNLGYEKTDKPENYMKRYQILIVDHKVKWEHPDWMRKYYRLSDVQESHTYFKVR